jgi:hypothetical protein
MLAKEQALARWREKSTIEQRRVEVLSAVVAVPRLLGLDPSEVHWVVGVHVGIGFSHVGEWMVAQEVLVAPGRSSTDCVCKLISRHIIGSDGV